MSATKREINEAKEAGIMFKLYCSPLEIKENGVVLQLTDNQDLKEEFFKCDSTIVAVSQSPKTNIVSNTTKKGTFASGDVVTGAKTVVQAVAQAKVVTNTIDEYCMSNAAW
ncbi:MAG: sudA: sulfide dehydrogenase subunit alpha [Clostridiaceae bacterium]|jgi:glutamate synthase (NADPH/NADH) small chain|nr:sudA: sulfide dehydrogenase subunit alpha [Clostridiaceae bacterium]